MLININCMSLDICVATLYYPKHLVECGNHKDAQYVRLECNLNIYMVIYIKYALWREYNIILTAIVCKPTNRVQFRRNFPINNYDVHRPQAHVYMRVRLWPLLQVRVCAWKCMCWYFNLCRIKSIQQTMWYKCMR